MKVIKQRGFKNCIKVNEVLDTLLSCGYKLTNSSGIMEFDVYQRINTLGVLQTLIMGKNLLYISIASINEYSEKFQLAVLGGVK